MFAVTTELIQDGIKREVQIGTAQNSHDEGGSARIHIFLTHTLARRGECLITLWDQADLNNQA